MVSATAECTVAAVALASSTVELEQATATDIHRIVAAAAVVVVEHSMTQEEVAASSAKVDLNIGQREQEMADWQLLAVDHVMFGNMLLVAMLQQKTAVNLTAIYMKKHSEDTNTAVVRWSQKILHRCRPLPGARDGQNLISWRWSLPLPTNRVWCGSMHTISSCRNRPTNRQD